MKYQFINSIIKQCVNIKFTIFSNRYYY